MEEQIVSLYQWGRSQRQICVMLGIKQAQVQTTLKLLGLSRTNSESMALYHAQRKNDGIPGPNQSKPKVVREPTICESTLSRSWHPA